ncbi:GtrA-like protein [Alcanivorax sp. 521-1]|uniref:GtrA-like protein n=1 Tax=Alloalcanivorax profundimaris TaxID=2735259 RepID=A0ABS0ASN2_9GAMM|nr:GtrA family protein [Alloalcanivorax profundimaris]MBF5057015.1 GtrA-like protein [Alloalcanivorax profundimaris]MBG14697.1 polysaccharide biosynthesis protein GtrA [Alcanivorax sp.]
MDLARALRPLRFLLSGGAATLVHWSSMAGLMAAGLAPAAATAGGALAGAVANFPLQQTWTFGGRFRAGAVPGYAAACGFGWMMNGALFLLLHQTLALAVAPAQVLTTALVALSNYTLYKRWVFHDGSRSSG